MALTDKLTVIADAIRGKTGKAGTLTLDQMATEISSIQSGGGSTAPTIEVSSSGLITATAGTESATKQLSTQAAKTVTPKASSQVAVMAGMYTTGAVTVAGDTNLNAANIKSGVSIFGVEGTYEGSGGTDSGSIETCSVKLINLCISDLVAWYSVVSNGKISYSMGSVGPGRDYTFTNVPRNSVFSFLPMGDSMGSVDYQNDLVNAQLVSSCEHLGAVVVGTNGTEVSITVNAPT